MCVCVCMHNASVSLCVCVFALVSITLANRACVHSGELRATDTARPRAKQGPDWSEGPYRAPGGPLMELSLCHVLAVQQPPLLSHTHHLHITHTHTQCLLVSTTQQFLFSWSWYQRGFKGTTVSDRRNIVISTGCKNRVTFKGKQSCLNFTSCVQSFDLWNLKRSWKAVQQRCLLSHKILYRDFLQALHKSQPVFCSVPLRLHCRRNIWIVLVLRLVSTGGGGGGLEVWK